MLGKDEIISGKDEIIYVASRSTLGKARATLLLSEIRHNGHELVWHPSEIRHSPSSSIPGKDACRCVGDRTILFQYEIRSYSYDSICCEDQSILPACILL